MASLVRCPLFPDPPTACSGFCMVIHDNHLYLWGGHTQELFRDDEESPPYPCDLTLPNTEENVMEVFDVLTNSWDSHATTGDVPHFGNGSTMVAYQKHLYLFGGWNKGAFTSEVYQMDTSGYVWEHLVVRDDDTKPTPRYLTNAVVFRSTMCVFGGVGPPIDPIRLQRDATYTGFSQYGNDYGFGWNNEMYLFHLEKRKTEH